MSLITDWLTSIILFILLATVIELLLPKSSFQRYVKIVVGLILLLLFLQPLLSILKKDTSEWLSNLPNYEYTNEAQIENLIENKKIEIENNQRAYISEQVAVQMKRQVEDELLKSFSLQITNIDISLNDQLTTFQNDHSIVEHVTVTVKEVSEVNEEKENAIELVKVVAIDTRKPLVEDDHRLKSGQVYDLLAEAWQIERGSISLVWEGREEDR